MPIDSLQYIARNLLQMTRRQLSELERLLSQYAHRYHSLQRIDKNKFLKIIQKYYINPYLLVEKQCCRNLKLSDLQPLSVKKLAMTVKTT